MSSCGVLRVDAHFLYVHYDVETSMDNLAESPLQARHRFHEMAKEGLKP